MRLEDIRKAGTLWLGAQRSKLPKNDLCAALRKALEDDNAAATALANLPPKDREVLAAYRRYGGTVNGAVIRLDLMARGALKKTTPTKTGYSSWSRWEYNPIAKLKERCVLLPARPTAYESYGYYGHGDETQRPFANLSLHAGLAKHVDPAGPPPWRLAPVSGTPQAVTRRGPAEVALDLSRVFAFLSSRGQIKVNKSGELPTPLLRTLAKAVPLDDDAAFPLPDPHGLYFELLRYTGLVRGEPPQLRADPAAATLLFTQPTAIQVYQWASGWLTASHWRDGLGVSGSHDTDYRGGPDGTLATNRQVLAWSLASLAHAGGHRFDLTEFLLEIYAIHGSTTGWGSWPEPRWNAHLPPAKDWQGKSGDERQRGYWFAHEGAGFANALMITLVALGLVERGRIGSGKSSPLCFRLTEWGRAIFGAPEITPPRDAEDQRFLVIQPNFDVVAYLDRADATSAGTLGQLAESDTTRSGPVRNFRLTRTSIYQALESGMTAAQVVDFLRRHSQNELPANVLQTMAEWSARRESLVLRCGVTLVGFGNTAARDAYLAGHAGSACGERFVRLTEATKQKLKIPAALASDHALDCRHTLKMDEYGHIHASQPYDIVQSARLRRFAERTTLGWQLTGRSVRQAAAAGLKSGTIGWWLQAHLAQPEPPLLAYAIDAWMGHGTPLELDDAVLLHVPDPDQFAAIAASPRLRPYLAGSPGPNWLVVKKELAEDFAAVLAELGFPVGRQLTHTELPENDRTDD
jgi:hypothetical protein